ncbi:AAA family ATPase [Flavobacterium oreochromis]|uniref:McrB family protein n=1 Tax=Flavobacterium oreochromis TaxID=2906078 RepID=UPI00385ACF9C
MILKDLNKLAIEVKEKVAEYKNFETTLPSVFKSSFTDLLLLENSKDKIEYQKYTAIVTTSKKLKVIFPNQWFYIASYFDELLNSLFEYKKMVADLNLSNDEIKNLKKGKFDETKLNEILESIESDKNRQLIKLFLTNYNWWFGSKTIDRGDFFVSSVLNIANVVNETSTYIATIAYFLSKSKDVKNSLFISNSESPKNSDLKKENIIYYGAPGTGKSFKVDREINYLDSTFYERITFHPEFDHASFIGGYKPVTENDEIKYKFIPQSFTNIYVRAWNDLENQYYLVIEEINRGNCAEIFGDIFQLLDRNSNYTVSPSNELKEYLNIALTNKDGIDYGLKLPSNLSILATMNTSDQSLFPMDSAFKRRWDWEYIPICYDDIPENESYEYNVIIDDTHSFKWIDFIKNINSVIKTNPNLGMDKCIGNYFIKSDSKEITLKEFVNKAIFYLWNDVFKDEDSSDSIFEKGTSYENFFPIETNGKKEVEKILGALNISIPVKVTM